MNFMEETDMLRQLEKKVQALYYEHFRTIASIRGPLPGNEELLTMAMPASVGEKLLRCRRAGCNEENIQASWAIAKKNAIDQFQYYRRRYQANAQPSS